MRRRIFINPYFTWLYYGVFIITFHKDVEILSHTHKSNTYTTTNSIRGGNRVVSGFCRVETLNGLKVFDLNPAHLTNVSCHVNPFIFVSGFGLGLYLEICHVRLKD